MVKVLRTLVILSLLATAAAAQQAPAAPHPSADALAARAVDVLGAAAWPQARYFAFTLTIERDGQVVSSFPQRWDRLTGDYRVSGKDPQGRPFEIVMNLNTMQGRATVDGEPVANPGRVKDMLEMLGNRRFVNDVFWLLMPLRMTEPDVARSYEGERSDSCGRVWDIVKLTFAKGGLVPGDTHWAWINRDTGIVEEWDMRLQSSAPDAPPTEIMLHDYRRVGGLLISMRREVHGAAQTVRIEDLQILPAPPKGAFQ